MDRTAYNALLAQYRVRELTGNGAVNWEDGVHCVIPEVKLFGKCGQNGTPTPEAPVQVKCNNGTFVMNGKNIFNYVPFVDAGYFSVDDEESGECTIIRTDSFPSVPVNTMKNTQYCVTFEFQGVLDGQNVIMVVNYTDGTSQSIRGSTDVSQFVTVQALTSANKTIESISFGASGGIRTGTKLRKVQIEASQAPTPYAPYFDGGTAQAPDLMAAVDGSCQSAYDPQTGALTDWWWPEIELRGDETWAAYTSGSWIGFRVINALPETMSRNAYWCNMFAPLKKGETASSPHLWCGVGNNILFAVASSSVGFPYYDDTLEDKGLANWKAHLAEQPLRVRVARNEPLLTYASSSRLIMPSGYGQIIQTGGDVADCPISVKYLAHS